MLRSDLCDYSDAHIVEKGTIHLLTAAANKIDKVEKNFPFRNKASFRSCISKIHSTLINNAEDLDIVISMSNLLEKHPERPVRPENPGDANWPPQPAVSNSNIEVTIVLKYLSNFWRFRNITLINWEMELDS